MTMKLHFSPASPFVRKVMALAVARGIDHLIEPVPTNPHVSPPELLRDNPLSKIPALVAEDGVAVYDSAVICDHLDRIGEAPRLIPEAGAARTRVLVQEALADGLMDGAVARRTYGGGEPDEVRTKLLTRSKAAVDRALDVLEADPPEGLGDLGAIAVGCALGYLDFRFAHEPWREGRPRLAAWFETVSALPPLARTAPVG